MSVSIYDAIAERFAQFEDREVEFCEAEITASIAVLQAAIQVLERRKLEYSKGQQPCDFKTCDRHFRIHAGSKRLLDLIEGREVLLPRF